MISKGCNLRSWEHTLRTEWISIWKDRITLRLVKCLCEWWPAQTKLWKSSLAWSQGKDFSYCCTSHKLKGSFWETSKKSYLILLEVWNSVHYCLSTIICHLQDASLVDPLCKFNHLSVQGTCISKKTHLLFTYISAGLWTQVRWWRTSLTEPKHFLHLRK